MTTIAITGVSGLVGHRLARSLLQRSDVDRLIGIDRRIPHGLASSRFLFRQADIRDPTLTEALAEVDVLIHLAFQLDPIHDQDLMREINVDGTRMLVEAAERVGVGQVICPSSVVAYGAHADNDLPLTEDSPLRGTPDLDCSEHTRDIERWLRDWSAEPRSSDLTVLRLALILGPGVHNYVTRMLEGPRLAVVRNHEPALQFVHLDDVVSAFEHVMDHRLTGTYNVSAEGWLTFDEVLALGRRRVAYLPEELAFGGAEQLWRFGIGEHPPGVVHHLMHPCVMSPGKLVATGWRPRVTSRAALIETVREHQDYVAVAGIRTRWSTLRKAAATLSAGVVLAAAVAWMRYRRTGAGAHRVRAPGSGGSGSSDH